MITFAVLVRLCALSGVMVGATSGCAGFLKHNRVTQYVNPNVDVGQIKRISVISDGQNRYDLQIMARARDRLSKSGVTVVRRSGLWESDKHALQDVCFKKPEATDNVDGVLFVRWDRMTLHDCGSGSIALDINGGYAGTDAMTDRLLQYLGGSALKSR